VPVIRREDGWTPRVAQDPAYLERVRVWTYSLSDGLAVKIGWSAGHPQRRLDDLQVGNPRSLVLLGYTAHLTESEAHRLYQRFHVRGEWFALDVVQELLNWDWLDTHAVRELLRNAFTLSPRR
jgi:hypothetical protein